MIARAMSQTTKPLAAHDKASGQAPTSGSVHVVAKGPHRRVQYSHHATPAVTAPFCTILVKL